MTNSNFNYHSDPFAALNEEVADSEIQIHDLRAFELTEDEYLRVYELIEEEGAYGIVMTRKVLILEKESVLNADQIMQHIANVISECHGWFNRND